jgi:hypothetical protein
MLVFLVVTSCELVGRYQRFEGTYCFHLQGLKYSDVILLRNVDIYLQVHTALQPIRRTYYSEMTNEQDILWQ